MFNLIEDEEGYFHIFLTTTHKLTLDLEDYV
jgi:hypothetical protein